MAPGESARFSATAEFSDGSTRDITNDVAWISSDDAVLSVPSGGLGTAHAVGEAEVRYQFNGRNSTFKRPVLVLNPGTFLLAGRVLDDEAPVFGAQVDVASGPAAGRSVLTDWHGGFKLIGMSAEDIAGEVVLRPTASGLSGALDGPFRITQNAYAAFPAAEACVSKTHGFTLSK